MTDFNLQNNIFVNELNRIDLKNFLIFLDSFYLKYRDNLKISSYITFGMELEYLGVNPRRVDFFINEIMKDWNSVVDWDSVRDSSIPLGGEINSPIMHDDFDCWGEVKKVCQFLKDNGVSNLVKEAGGHIHVGANILTSDYKVWRKFLKLYTIFEDVLYRFCYGDKINGRENIMFFAKPLADILLFKMWRFDYIRDLDAINENFSNETRNYGLNLKHVNFEDISTSLGNTIEFRFPNATIEEVIWQNNINVLVKFLLAALDLNLDEDYLDSLLDEMDDHAFSGDIVYNYDCINFRKALLLADLIFDNTLDKVYFLKQYFKNFQTAKEKELVLARNFII